MSDRSRSLSPRPGKRDFEAHCHGCIECRLDRAIIRSEKIIRLFNEVLEGDPDAAHHRDGLLDSLVKLARAEPLCTEAVCSCSDSD